MRAFLKCFGQSICFVELLESRRMLTAYTAHTLSSFKTTLLAAPQGQMVENKSGDLFFVAHASGGNTQQEAVWFLAPGATTPAQLAVFPSGEGGGSDLVIDSGGDIFGTTSSAGTNGQGSVWEIVAESKSIVTVASFTHASTGNTPNSTTLAINSSGDVFGTTGGGGANDYGTIWEYQPNTQSLTSLASFTVDPNGGKHDGITIDSEGDLFGVGGINATSGTSYGYVWELPVNTPTIETRATFNGTNGNSPEAPLAVDSAGDIYGVTAEGGKSGPNGVGTIFEILAGGSSIKTLVNFDGVDGYLPAKGLLIDSAGDLFGETALSGASGDGPGFLFELPAGQSTTQTLSTSFATDQAETYTFLNGKGDLIKVIDYSVEELAPSSAATTGLKAIVTGKLPTKTFAPGSNPQIKQTLTITNLASSSINQSVTERVYLSTNAVVTSKSAEISATKIKVKLKAHKSGPYGISITMLPTTLAKGHYYLVVQLTAPSGTKTVAASSARISVK